MPENLVAKSARTAESVDRSYLVLLKILTTDANSAFMEKSYKHLKNVLKAVLVFFCIKTYL